MRINGTVPAVFYAGRDSYNPIDSSKFSSLLSKASVSPPEITVTKNQETEKPVDFSHMTHEDLFNWMNAQMAAGKMTVDESTPFLAMSMHIPVDGDALQDASWAAEPVNFLDLTREGIAGARSRGDQHDAQMLMDALNAMLKSQTKVNVSV